MVEATENIEKELRETINDIVQPYITLIKELEDKAAAQDIKSIYLVFMSIEYFCTFFCHNIVITEYRNEFIPW